MLLDLQEMLTSESWTLFLHITPLSKSPTQLPSQPYIYFVNLISILVFIKIRSWNQIFAKENFFSY